MSDKKIRISEELYEQLQKLAEKNNRSMRELAEEAIKAYLLGTENIEKPVKSITGKIIPLQYKARCRFCGKEIKQGELAYWAKYTFTDNTTRSYVVCLDCYYKDTALAEWYLKKKKLESVVRGLKKKADQLVREIEKLQVQYDVMKVKQEVMDIWRSFKSIFLSAETNLTYDKVEEFLDKISEVLDRIGSLEASLHALVHEKSRARKTANIPRYEERREWV